MHDRHPGVPGLGLVMMVHGMMLAALGFLTLCGAPIQVMEGEELDVIIFSSLWAMALAVVGVLQVVSGRMLRSYRGRWLALLAANAQLPLSCCFCGGLSLIVWIWASYLLLLDRRAVASFYAPDF